MDGRVLFNSLLSSDAVDEDLLLSALSNQGCAALRYAGVAASFRLAEPWSPRVRAALVERCLDSVEAVVELAALVLSRAAGRDHLVRVCAVANARNGAFDAALAWLLQHDATDEELASLSGLVRLQLEAQRSSGGSLLGGEPLPPPRSWHELAVLEALPEARPDLALYCAELFAELAGADGEAVSAAQLREWAARPGSGRLPAALPEQMDAVAFARVLIAALDSS